MSNVPVLCLPVLYYLPRVILFALYYLWDRKRIVEMRYYFGTQDDKNKEQKVRKNEKYVKRKEGCLTLNVYY
jgi:hypothetical protein